jgi:hypothetical protein
VHYAAGGLFTAACYRWPLLGLMVIIFLLGFVCSQIDHQSIDCSRFVQDWSPTIVKDVRVESPLFDGLTPGRGNFPNKGKSMMRNQGFVSGDSLGGK